MVTIKKITPGLLLCAVFPLLGHAEGLLAVDNPAKNGQEHSVYAALEAFEGNDQIAMRQYGGGWQGGYSPRNGTNLGVLSARAETGVQWQGYRLGALYRAEGLVEANRDASDLIRQYVTRSGYDIGRIYQLDYRIKAFEADGARLSKSFRLDLGGQWQMDWGLGLSYLRGKRIKLETASGQAVALDAKDFDAAAILDDTNSQINITDLAKFNPPYGRLAAPSGQGYALDAGLVLRHRESGLRAELAVADLAGRMEWQDLPNNVANYNTANKYYDADGYVHFDATATRVSSYRNLTQILAPKVWLAAAYPLGGFELQGATSFTRGYWFPQAGVTYQLNPSWQLKADYDFRFKTVGLNLRHRWFFAGLRADSIDMNSAKAYGANVGINILF
jgi:hypothetical protein